MICLAWWQWMSLFVVGEWCRRFGAVTYDAVKAWRKRRKEYSLISRH